ncbi:MAG: helix-turn-helix transcriptional regulator [Eubacterium sp.]|nr:helix-turn-helix transcriptional regulator [Eubacterium sp.]
MNEKCELNVTIGSRLKRVREEAFLNVAQMAEFFEMSRENYRRMESGKQAISPDKFKMLRQYMRVDLNWLICGTEKMEDSDRAGNTGRQKILVMEQLYSYCSRQEG